MRYIDTKINNKKFTMWIRSKKQVSLYYCAQHHSIETESSPQMFRGRRGRLPSNELTGIKIRGDRDQTLENLRTLFPPNTQREGDSEEKFYHYKLSREKKERSEKVQQELRNRLMDFKKQGLQS